MKKLIPVVIVAALLAVVASTQVSKHHAKPAPIIELHRTAAAKFFEPAKSNMLFVLIIGSDVREGDPARGRSDSLHILALNTKTATGTMVGIPRDSWVPIPGHGTTKINASLTFGGPTKTVETVRSITGIPIQYWALIDFSRFRKLVDALGGVPVRVPYAMHDHFSGADFNKGVYHMNGAQALAFARNRHAAINGDFGRSENQGRLLLACLAQFRKDTSDPLKLAMYMNSFKNYVASNVPMSEMIDLARLGARIDPSKIHNMVVPGHAGSAGSASVVFITPGDLFAKIKDDGKL